MRSIIIILLIAVFHFQLLAQEYSDKTSYETSVGWKISIGDNITIGEGRNPDKSYQFLERKGKALPAAATGQLCGVSKIIIETSGSGHTVCTVTLNNSSLGTIKADIEKAIYTCEIVCPQGYDISNIPSSVMEKGDVDYYTASNSITYREREMLQIGTGSMPDGDFKFIRRSATSLFTYYSTTGYQGLANQANSLPRSCSGLKYEIVRIDNRGSKKRGYVKYLIITMGGGVRYEVDIENALRVGEVPNTGKPINTNSNTPVVQQLSTADELKKLHELKKDGILTEDEYQAEKKKLLGK